MIAYIIVILFIVIVGMGFAVWSGYEYGRGLYKGVALYPLIGALIMDLFAVVLVYDLIKRRIDETPRCPQCNTEIVEEYQYCPACGYELEGEGNG